MTTYLDIDAALDRAKQLAGLDSLDFSRDDFATELLTLTAGIVKSSVVGVPDVTHYRPFFVAARLLQTDLDVQALTEADRTKFSRQDIPIATLLQMQSAYDQLHDLVIPSGFAAQIIDTMPVMSIFTA